MRARRSIRHTVAWACLGVAAGAFLPAPAGAHFILMAPDSWMSQDASGLPEKLGPCGDEGGGTPTGAVTSFHPGDTVTVTIDEVIPHPGHYRVALSIADRSELPPEPAVTPKPDDPCGSAAVENPPVLPILADDVLPHTQPFAGPRTFTVTLPRDVTCSKCTLQVLEFMSSHPAPCFYHHCADISVSAADGPVSTTSTTLASGGGSTTTTTVACATPRCSVDTLVQGAACGADTIPLPIRRELYGAPPLLEEADASPPRKAGLLRRKARRLFRRAGSAAVRASRGRKAKLSAGCAAAIKATTDRLASD